MKTALLAVLSVVVAVALIFAGTLLAAAVPEVDQAAQKVLGSEEDGEDTEGSPASDLDLDLQKEIFQELQQNFYKPVDADALAISAVEGMLAGLDDPYTVYYDPQEYADLLEETSGSYSGVGMVLMMNGRLPTVVSVFEGSPAAAAGLKSGDIILAVDDLTTSGRTLDEVVSDIKGEEGTDVTLEMYRPATTTTTSVPGATGDDGQGDTSTGSAIETLTIDLTGLPQGGIRTEYTLTRRSIVIPTTKAETLEVDGKKVAYVILYTFNSENAAQQLRADIEAAIARSEADAIILDLRGNGGGLLDEAVKVASIFIKSGVIVSTEGLHYPEQVAKASGGAIGDIPLYVLTDRFSASASEIVAGALQDYGRATIVGETTFGKGLVQRIEPLSEGGALKVTIEVYLTPKGRDINQTGIAPDVVAPDDPATEDVDETLNKALDLLTSDSAPR